MLSNRALIIQNITYTPLQDQQQTKNVPSSLTESGQTPVQRTLGSIYVLCREPFNTDGKIVSWTFAARQNENVGTIGDAFLYPQLLILRPQLTQRRFSQPCNASLSVFSTTMITNPPILLETINMYRVDTNLSYESGDVLGVFQPRELLAVQSLAFVNSESESSNTVLTLGATLESGQIAVNTSVSPALVRTQPLMSISTDQDNEPQAVTTEDEDVDENEPTFPLPTLSSIAKEGDNEDENEPTSPLPTLSSTAKEGDDEDDSTLTTTQSESMSNIIS